MTFLELVQKRNSCRQYAERPVPRESIERCLEAARLAPSACNAQPWQFLAVEDGPLRRTLAEKAFSGVYRFNAFAAQAPVLVAVVREKTSIPAMMGGIIRGMAYNLIDIGIAGEHFVLQAQEEGLGTCWIGWFDERAVKRVLGIPSRKKIDVLISLGYPAAPPGPKKKRKELHEMSELR